MLETFNLHFEIVLCWFLSRINKVLRCSGGLIILQITSRNLSTRILKKFWVAEVVEQIAWAKLGRWLHNKFKWKPLKLSGSADFSSAKIHGKAFSFWHHFFINIFFASKYKCESSHNVIKIKTNILAIILWMRSWNIYCSTGYCIGVSTLAAKHERKTVRRDLRSNYFACELMFRC